jgi:acetyltransferase-like isoleucine patch superfamily enzyme
LPPPLSLSLLRELARPARDAVRLAAHRARWRRENPNNFTTAGTIFPRDRVSVGNLTYGPLNLLFFGHPEEVIRIGAYCSIAADVTILAGGEHPFDRASSYPLQRHVAALADTGSAPKGPVTIGDDVWIGRGCTILSGVTVGQGAVLGAGSVIARDVPPYAVHAGGRVVRYRFPADEVAALLALDWSGVSRDEIVANLVTLTAPLTPDFFESPFYLRHVKDPSDVEQ